MDVKLLREQTGLTQEQLAERSGIPRDRIAKWEQGKGKPKMSDYLKLDPIFKELIPKDGKKDDQLPSGGVVVTMKDYITEIKQQKEFLQELLLKRVNDIDANLKQTLGGVAQLSLHVESAREVVLDSLTRLEKKPKGALRDEADNIVKQLMKEQKKQGSSSAVGK